MPQYPRHGPREGHRRRPGLRLNRQIGYVSLGAAGMAGFGPTLQPAVFEVEICCLDSDFELNSPFFRASSILSAIGPARPVALAAIPKEVRSPSIV